MAAIRGRRAQEACPCPRLLKVNPFGVPTAAGTEAKRTLRGTAFEAALLIKPPALRGVSNLLETMCSSKGGIVPVDLAGVKARNYGA